MSGLGDELYHAAWIDGMKHHMCDECGTFYPAKLALHGRYCSDDCRAIFDARRRLDVRRLCQSCGFFLLCKCRPDERGGL